MKLYPVEKGEVRRHFVGGMDKIDVSRVHVRCATIIIAKIVRSLIKHEKRKAEKYGYDGNL